MRLCLNIMFMFVAPKLMYLLIVSIAKTSVIWKLPWKKPWGSIFIFTTQFEASVQKNLLIKMNPNM